LSGQAQTVVTNILLLPDAGPLITLAYAQSLDLLFKPGWPVCIVDMVLEEVTRNQTPTSLAIADWAKVNNLQVLPTKTLAHLKHLQASAGAAPRKSNLGELAIQEAMNDFALIDPPPTGVFVFEDHKIARTSFLLPAQCRKVSTRAFLIFLEQKGWLKSAAEVERKAILNGRTFSKLRFPS
jgi:cellulose biosynthesis protein BcsQ